MQFVFIFYYLSKLLQSTRSEKQTNHLIRYPAINTLTHRHGCHLCNKRITANSSCSFKRLVLQCNAMSAFGIFTNPKRASNSPYLCSFLAFRGIRRLLVVVYTVCTQHRYSSFSRAVLLFLTLPEFLDVLLNGLVDATLQLRTVAKREEDLEPHKKRSEENGLYKVVEQRWSSSLKLAVPDELRYPTGDVYCDCPVVGGGTIRRCQVVGNSGRTNEKGCEHGSGYRLHEYVQGRIQGRSCRADIKGEVRDGEP